MELYPEQTSPNDPPPPPGEPSVMSTSDEPSGGHGHSHVGPGVHHHPHAPGRERDRKRLGIALGLAATYMVAEAVGGWLTGSLALLADAGHMLSDTAALALALFALRFAQRPPTAEHTYGFHRVEILAALANGATLLAIAVLIVVEAVQRLAQPPEVDAPVMMAIAGGGLVVNGLALAVLHGGREGSLNLQGAWLHVLMDTLGSLQALAAGGLILAFGWGWADPVASVLIALLVVWSAWALLRETLGVLMEATPSHIDLEQVRQSLLEDGAVEDVHDLHVWTITSGFVALSAHVVSQAGEEIPGPLLRRLRDRLRQRFDIEHATLQIEPEDLDAQCRNC